LKQTTYVSRFCFTGKKQQKRGKEKQKLSSFSVLFCYYFFRIWFFNIWSKKSFFEVGILYPYGVWWNVQKGFVKFRFICYYCWSNWIIL